MKSLTSATRYRVKVEQRISGSNCVTTVTFDGTEVFNLAHSCGSYTAETIQAWYGGNYYNGDGYRLADGFVDTFRFVWL